MTVEKKITRRSRPTFEQIGMVQGMWEAGFSTMRDITVDTQLEMEQVKYLIKKKGWERGAKASMYEDRAREAIESEISSEVRELAVSRQTTKDTAVKLSMMIENRMVGIFKRIQDEKKTDAVALADLKSLEMATRIISNSFHTKRYALGLDKTDPGEEAGDALIEVLEMSADEVADIRKKQEKEVEEMDAKGVDDE
jgi:hypothetical protein